MKYLESYEERRLKEINLLDDYKEYAREIFYDLMDNGYIVYPSYGSIMNNGENDFVNYVVRINKSDGRHGSKPFMFSEVVDSVDDFIHYLEHIKAESIHCQVVFENYDDDKEFKRQYGELHTWEGLKRKIREYIDTPAVLSYVRIDYTINI